MFINANKSIICSKYQKLCMSFEEDDFKEFLISVAMKKIV